MRGPSTGAEVPGSADAAGDTHGGHEAAGVYSGPLDGRGEGPLRRADRNMIELLQELRVAQTGVQILFAFLLSLSFTQRFASIDAVQLWTYVVTLLCSVLTAGLLVAPAAVHRITFGRGVKAETVRLGHRLFALGLSSLMVTLTGAVLLVLDVAVGRNFAIAAATVVAVLLGTLWFLLPVPLVRRRDTATPDSGKGPSPGEGETAPARAPSD